MSFTIVLENIPIPPEQAVEMSNVKERNIIPQSKHKRGKWVLDGLKTFIQNTGDRLEERAQGILVGSHQWIKIMGKLGLGRMRNYFVSFSPIYPENN